MGEEEDFLRAIAAAPGDDAPRLVYADWLDERQDPRAAFLRAEVALASVPGAAAAELRARLLDVRGGLDPAWWPRIARPGPGPRLAFRCAVCRAPLTGLLWPVADPIWISWADQTPLVPAGYYWRAGPDVGPRAAGHYCVHPADLRNVRPHPDSRRWTGCCGPDGCGRPNTVCPAGHEVGTECGDCWMPHYVHLDPSAVAAESRAPADEPDSARRTA